MALWIRPYNLKAKHRTVQHAKISLRTKKGQYQKRCQEIVTMTRRTLSKLAAATVASGLLIAPPPHLDWPSRSANQKRGSSVKTPLAPLHPAGCFQHRRPLLISCLCIWLSVFNVLFQSHDPLRSSWWGEGGVAAAAAAAHKSRVHNNGGDLLS